MIKKLRKKFIAIAMCSMALVLFVIMAGINIANYTNVCRNADMRIHVIAENDGKFPENPADDTPKDDNQTPPEPKKEKELARRDISPESAFDTRFFTVTITDKGTVDQVDTGKIAAVSTKEAKKYAASLYKKQHTLGFISCYRYQLVTTGDNTRMYIFVNCERELNTFHTFLLASIGVSLAGLLLVFLLVVLFSGMLVKPVAESYEKQKRFITDASHEIKTPLTIIDANTEVLEMTGGENQWTKSTRKQIARLTSLTEKLVFLSRMDEESTQLEMTDFAISDAVIDTAEPFVSYAAFRGKTLELDIAPDLTYHGNEGCIRQCVSLLLDNAVKYSTENGKLRLTFHKQGRALALTVWNTTDPIPVGRHDELFERFYRPDSSRNTKTGGHGIGLSVVHAIATAHKGKISAKSEDGNSLTFSILLN